MLLTLEMASSKVLTLNRLLGLAYILSEALINAFTDYLVTQWIGNDCLSWDFPDLRSNHRADVFKLR